MKIEINETLIYYWLFAIIFETIYCWITLKIVWYKFKKKSPQQHDYVLALIDSFKQNPSIYIVWKKIFNPFGYTAIYVIFCIIAPIFFPFSLIILLKKMVGYKSKLEKKAYAMEQAYDKSQEWLKNEGREMPEQYELKVGTILIAKSECKMNSGRSEGKPALIIGKEYPIKKVMEPQFEIIISSETDEEHYFDIPEKEEHYYGKFFDVKK